MIKDIQKKIQQLKKEKDICILAHSYQKREIIEAADFIGDSYQLSVMASKAPNKTIIMCGVRFMAETVKILSPEKTVYLANPTAGCPMAEQFDVEKIRELRSSNPDYAVVAYVNTTAELKTVADVCVTSSSAVKIVSAMENKDIIFIPDCNLGSFVAKELPEKNIMMLHGGCPVHSSITESAVLEAKAAHPNALFLVHPECVPAVVAHADFVGSTSAIMKFAEESERDEFIIGTENSIAEHLQYSCPDKRFYYLSKGLICPDMKATTLIDLYECVKNGGEEVILPDDILSGARRCIDEMIRLGG